MRARLIFRLPIALAALLPQWSCAESSGSSNGAAQRPLSRQELMDPQTCRSCHPGQYAEWAGSMHAYAADDPVFVALNRRGQEETNGRLGSFCVNCHAPLALSEGKTHDGTNLGELEPMYRGVTCYFCHSVDSVEGEHNNPLELAQDGVMRGPFDDAFPTSAHSSGYSSHLDAAHTGSAKMCGACHDVQLTPAIGAADFALERTYAEWQDSLFSRPVADGGLTCNGCHLPMAPDREQTAQVPNAPARGSRRHDFEGIDLPLIPFAGAERQRILVEQFLASSLLAEICVSETGFVQLTLENVGSGHGWPSGATHHRQPWVELEAFTQDSDEPVFALVDPELATGPSQTLVLSDEALDAEGEPTQLFWEVASFGVSNTIPAPITRDPTEAGFHRERGIWTFDTRQTDVGSIERVTLRVRLRAFKPALLNELVQSGHLDAALADAQRVLDVLPDRCPDAALRQRYPELLGGERDCDPSDERRDFTLVWQRDEASRPGPRQRQARVEGAPALCYAHPTFVAVPPPL